MSDSLGSIEWVLWALNALVCAGMLARCYLNRDVMALWSPPSFIGAIYAYYVVVGPLFARQFGGVMDRGVDMRPYYGIAWAAALVALLSWMFGYYVLRSHPRRSPREGAIWTDDAGLWRLGFVMNLVGLLAFLATAGLSGFRTLGITAADDPTLAEATYSGAFANYLTLAVNFLIAGSSVLFLARLRGRGSWFVFGVWMFIAVVIYVTLGFRYRLVLMTAGLTFIYYLHHRKRPNLIFLSLVATMFVVVMGVIGATRNYGQGLDLSRNTQSLGESFLSGFGEASIFGTSGAVLHHVPKDRPLVWADPIKQTLLMPVPSRFFPGKATNTYMLETLITIYGPDAYQGAAFMFFAEVYQMFWWPGIIVAHVALGWVCRWLWQWYRLRGGDPLALIVYAAAIPFLYVLYSRGYLPQIVMIFFFSVAPAIALYRWPKAVVGLAHGLRRAEPIDSRGRGRGAALPQYLRVAPPPGMPPPRQQPRKR